MKQPCDKYQEGRSHVRIQEGAEGITGKEGSGGVDEAGGNGVFWEVVGGRCRRNMRRMDVGNQFAWRGNGRFKGWMRDRRVFGVMVRKL